MLKQANRLKDRADFMVVRQAGRRWRSDLMTLNVYFRQADAPARFGFVVSKEVGKAVVRNRLKRRLRAIIGGWLAQLARGYDVVIVARPRAAEASYAELQSALLDLLRRADVWGGKPEALA